MSTFVGRRTLALLLLLAVLVNACVAFSPAATHRPRGSERPSPNVSASAAPSPSAVPSASAAPSPSAVPSARPRPSAVPSASPPPGATASPSHSATPSATAGVTPTPAVSAPLASTPPTASPIATPSAEDPRVTAALATLTTDQDLVGQLLLVGWSGSTPGSVRKMLSSLRPGGVVFVANATTAATAKALNQAIADGATQLGMLPPIRTINHEGGQVQTITDVRNLGSNGAFGSRGPTDLQACQRGAAQARQLSGMGFDMDLAPVIDVLTDPNNTVIGDRAYGSSAALVARLGAAYIQGMQGAGIMAVAKHFPGHGGTAVDSHLGLPVLPFTRARLDRIDLVPFVRAIAPGVDVAGIVVGHLALPKLDPSGDPASLSRAIITGLLRHDLGYSGLVLTDDLGAMAAITANFAPGQAAVKAVAAGADMLIVVGDKTRQLAMRDALVAALASGKLDRGRVLDAVRHVLEAKAQYGMLGGDGPTLTSCGS
jgi:beta-N-acetylhexosaminidase